jgi:hypothetical protein
MARETGRGAEQLISTTTLDQLGPWLADYAQQAQLTLLTEVDWPGGHPQYQRFWCLVGPALAVLIAVPLQVSGSEGGPGPDPKTPPFPPGGFRSPGPGGLYAGLAGFLR